MDPATGSGSDEARRDEAEWGERAQQRAPLAGLAGRRRPPWRLYFALPDRLITGLGPRWLVPALEGVLGVALLIANPRLSRESRRLRPVAITLIAFVNLANVVSLGELVHELLAVHAHTRRAGATSSTRRCRCGSPTCSCSPCGTGSSTGAAPWHGSRPERRQPDFLFPQMTAPDATVADWSPAFIDYLFTSFTNATAFSPTDTMPLTPWAKMLMMVQSLASLLTVALVVSRAVNILN